MKKLLLPLIFLSAISAFAQSPVNVSNEDISTVVETAQSVNYASLTSAIQTLEAENEIYKATINANSNIFGGISTYFTVIAILLSIIVIAIPVINYFLVLKPNAKVLEKIETMEADVLKKMEQNFGNYFEGLTKRRAKNIIDLLDDRTKVSQVTNYLLLNDTDNLDESDYIKIVTFLTDNKDIGEYDANILHSALIYSGHQLAEKYYKSIFDSDDVENYKYAIHFFVENQLESHLNYISKILTSNDDGHKLLIEFTSYIFKTYIGSPLSGKRDTLRGEIGASLIKLLFNDDRILKAIEGKKVPEVFGRGGHPININQLNWNPFLRETKYYQIYLQSIDKKFTK